MLEHIWMELVSVNITTVAYIILYWNCLHWSHPSAKEIYATEIVEKNIIKLGFSVLIDMYGIFRAQLEESRQAMSANKSRGRVLDSLIKEKNSGRLPGIFGRLVSYLFNFMD